MALYRSSTRLVIMALAIFVSVMMTNAFAQTKATVPARTIGTPSQETAEEKVKDQSEETLEERLERLKDYKKATKDRMKRLTNETLESTVGDELEDAIQQRASEIEIEQAEERARKQVSKYDTPAMRKARREVMKREKNLRGAVEDQEVAKRNTALSCQNPDDMDKVFIHPSMKRSFEVMTHSRMTITNATPFAVNIRRVSGRGVTNIVTNLCPGGTLSLFERPVPLMNGPTVVQYMAVSTTGEPLSNEVSPQIYIQPCYGSYCQAEFPARWQIEARR